MILLLLLNLAVLLWFLATELEEARVPGRKQAYQCPACQQDIEQSWSSCPYCEEPLTTFCTNCRHKKLRNQKYCPQCGHLDERNRL